ncbi:MAG: hypothetical protein WCR67_01890, partial [Bacilli bacterium]
NDLSLLRCKVSRAEQMILSNCQAGNNDIKSKKISSSADLQVTKLKVDNNLTNIIRVSGLGFISFIGHGQEIEVYAPKGVEVSIQSDLKA